MNKNIDFCSDLRYNFQEMKICLRKEEIAVDIINKTAHRLMNVLLKTTAAVPYTAPAKPIKIDKSEFRTDYPFVFVSGFWSWGPYKKGYETLPYWGFFNCDNYCKSFTQSGIRTESADVSPMGSAWDRACELYAQLTGTRVDYGRAHSEKFSHSRYGEDYTGRGILEKWDEKNKINIICHSFGGPTSALFASLLEYGSDEEKAATADGTLSPLFEGGKGSYIHSITGIAGAYNGTTLIVARQAIADCLELVRSKTLLPSVNPAFIALSKIASAFEKITGGDTPDPDTGLYDMVPDNSVELNKTIRTVDSVYYFTVPVCTSKPSADGKRQIPDFKVTDPFFALLVPFLGLINQTTPGGLELRDAWQMNDGLVNTVSEYGPAKEEKVFLEKDPCAALDLNDIKPGKYYVFKTFAGSHNTLCGGTIGRYPGAKDYIKNLMEFINRID